MKKLVHSAAFVIVGTVVGSMFFGAPVPTADAGENCCNCGSGSSADQCKQRGSDTSERRKVCEKAGCKITGTGSCSTAANVKVIDPG